MKVCIIGSGTMGSGIAQAFAQAGIPTVMKGLTDAELRTGLDNIARNLAKLEQKGKISPEQKTEVLEAVTGSLSFDDCAEADLVIEAIYEDTDAKREVFEILDRLCAPETIIASNTSSLSITQLGAFTNRPNRVVGMHFFNPAPVMKLVEIIRGQKTSDKTARFVTDMAVRIGKTPVDVNEAPGFVVNRMLVPMVNEAIGILAEGVASAEDIDKAMQLGANHPMGPLALGDLIGLDVCLAIMEVLYVEFADSKYRPHPLLRKKVRAGELGRKSGIGFYDYRT